MPTTFARRGILYVPDFVGNCGGLIHVDADQLGEGGERLESALADAEHRTREILAEALESGELPTTIAEQRAWSRIRAARAEIAAAQRR